MTAAPRMHPEPHLIDCMPAVRGRLTADAPLANVTWFRVGGPAEVMFKPADVADLGDFLAGCPADVPVTVIGVASNLLIRDGGVPGVVIRLGRAFVDMSVNGCEITTGAAALDLNVANAARDAGIAGLEFLSGIPGTIGGALRMNGGAYGRELSDVVVSATALDRSGVLHTLSREDLGLSYRHSNVPEDWIFTSAVLRGHPGDHAEISRRMHEIATSRAESQPVKARTGGSTFANPPGEKAWALIDRAGCRGLTIGGAQVSEKHCNFLLNLGTATADDLESLGEEVRRRVYETSGIQLRWEIRRIGVPASFSTRSQENRP
jgi:UDP-N-acetylmuramate dehydrogenase